MRGRPYDFSYFLAALFLSSIIVTSVGTSLISYRILCTTRENPSIASLAPYRKIQRIVIESGVVYSIAMLIAGIIIVAVNVLLHRRPFTASDGVILETKYAVVLTYTQALLTPLAVRIIIFICNHQRAYYF